MFRLKYKFKKILRFLNKILRVILIFGCIASLLCFEASAAVYRDDDTFKEAFGDSVASLYSSVYEEEYILTSDDTYDDYMVYYIPSSITSFKWANFFVDESILSRISAGNVIKLKGEILIRSNLQQEAGATTDGFVDYIVNNGCPLYCNFLSDQMVKTIAIDTRPSVHIRGFDQRKYVKYEFDFLFTIPEDYDFYDDFSLYFHVELDSSSSGFQNSSFRRIYVGSDNFHLYVGDETNAPIYPEYDSNFPENIEGKEEIAFEEAGEGLSEVGSFIGQFQNIFENGGPTVAGLMFINMFMDDLSLNIPWIRILLVISLSLGVITVILGVFNVVKRGK